MRQPAGGESESPHSLSPFQGVGRQTLRVPPGCATRSSPRIRASRNAMARPWPMIGSLYPAASPTSTTPGAWETGPGVVSWEGRARTNGRDTATAGAHGRQDSPRNSSRKRCGPSRPANRCRWSTEVHRWRRRRAPPCGKPGTSHRSAYRTWMCPAAIPDVVHQQAGNEMCRAAACRLIPACSRTTDRRPSAPTTRRHRTRRSTPSMR